MVKLIKESKQGKEVWFDDLGYFTKRDIDNIKKVMDGKTFMKFEVISSNQAGNYSLGVYTDYDATEEEIKNMFLSVALSNLGR